MANRFASTLKFTYEGELTQRQLRKVLLRAIADVEGVELDAINVEDPDVDVDKLETYEAVTETKKG